MWDYDFYVDMPRYDGPVLILHGDRDEIVPMSYSERAAATYKNARLRVIDGGGYGFQGATFAQAIGFINEHFRALGILK